MITELPHHHDADDDLPCLSLRLPAAANPTLDPPPHGPRNEALLALEEVLPAAVHPRAAVAQAADELTPLHGAEVVEQAAHLLQ